MEARRRGRPREYDPEIVLGSAIDMFLTKGYAATSLDDLARAMNMNRPSLYNAFGNKESIYRQALEQFTATLRKVVGSLLFEPRTLKRSLLAFYAAAMDLYFADDPPQGCFVFCTAPVEAISHPEIAADIRTVLDELDSLLKARFEQAQAEGEFPASSDCALAAQLAQALLHSIALRARAGDSRRRLNRLARYGVESVCR